MGELWQQYWSDEEEDHDWWKQPSPEVLRFIDSQSPAERPDVLDLGCGLGRHAMAFARAEFRVTAIDTSETAIAHLREWAQKLGVAVCTRVCDAFDASLQDSSFDIILSFNVIYHGFRDQFVCTIERVHRLLKPSGLFFFTCPSRQDGKYGHGEQVAPDTFRGTKSVIPRDIDYFADEQDLNKVLAGYRLLRLEKEEKYWDHDGEQQFSSYWQVLAQKL
jgi:SAM-dependent methyltransferase